MTIRESRPGETEAAPEPVATSQPEDTAATGSRVVHWWFVHEFVEAVLATVGTWPMVGTWAWHDLPDDDPRKLAAIYDAAQHWALRVQTCQEAVADAGSEISQAADWSAISRHIYDRAVWEREHPWHQRVVS